MRQEIPHRPRTRPHGLRDSGPQPRRVQRVQRLDVVLARLGLLARSIEITPIVVLHPPSRRGTNRGRR
jgi:hypothetical protein